MSAADHHKIKRDRALASQGTILHRAVPRLRNSTARDDDATPQSSLDAQGSLNIQGSILMDVTLRPHAFRMKPTLLAITPLPMPLMTPPETRMYFMLVPVRGPRGEQVRSAGPGHSMALGARRVACGGRSNDNQDLRAIFSVGQDQTTRKRVSATQRAPKHGAMLHVRAGAGPR